MSQRRPPMLSIQLGIAMFLNFNFIQYCNNLTTIIVERYTFIVQCCRVSAKKYHILQQNFCQKCSTWVAPMTKMFLAIVSFLLWKLHLQRSTITSAQWLIIQHQIQISNTKFWSPCINCKKKNHSSCSHIIYWVTNSLCTCAYYLFSWKQLGNLNLYINYHNTLGLTCTVLWFENSSCFHQRHHLHHSCRAEGKEITRKIDRYFQLKTLY